MTISRSAPSPSSSRTSRARRSLLHELGAEAYDEALITHRSALREAFQRHGGVEVDTQGDAFFYAFPTAPGAVDAAREGIEALSSGPIRVRVGLHTGTPHIGREGYIGDDVHLGARIAATAHGGQVVLSRETRVLVDGAITDLGEHRLKDISEAVPIFQLGDGSFPPLKTISNTNLPTPASSFVGRDDELLEVLSRFEEGARLVTLTGPGGTGKTRLAIEAASDLVPSYKAGVFWTGLATLRDPALVTETIGQTLGAKNGLAAHIREREMLLLLDNLEQVIEAGPELSELLTACPNLTLLVTSRELLRIQGEVEYAVPPLAEREAVALFCERSQLEPSDEISELCRRLDSLPLAVELAAARTSALTPGQILQRVSRRLDLLRGGRDADPRQQTLRATIEWSYELLSAEEKQLFARLSVFVGGCTLDAAEEVCDADIDTLQSLVEKSLVRFTGGRYWMLETIREYASERLAGADDGIESERRHSEFFIGLAATADALRVGGGTAWLDVLGREQNNFRVVFARLAQAGRIPELYDLFGVVLPFWFTRGELREGLRLCRDALARAPDARTDGHGRTLKLAGIFAINVGEHDAAVAYTTGSLTVLRELGNHDQISAALINLGGMLSESAPEDARKHLEEAVVEGQRAGLPSRVAIARGNLAAIELIAGNFELAIPLLEDVVRAERELGDDVGIVMPLFNLALANHRTGRDEPAAVAAREALEVGFRVGDVRGLINLLFLAANVAARRGDALSGGLLVGAAESAQERIGLHRVGARAEQALVEEATRSIRMALGEKYSAARATGGDDARRGRRGARSRLHRLSAAWRRSKTSASGSRCSSARASCIGLPLRSTRTSRSPRSSIVS